jgi:hypothetical protein
VRGCGVRHRHDRVARGLGGRGLVSALINQPTCLKPKPTTCTTLLGSAAFTRHRGTHLNRINPPPKRPVYSNPQYQLTEPSPREGTESVCQMQLSVSGYLQCPFHARALAVARLLQANGRYDLVEMTFGTRQEFRTWLLASDSGRALFSDPRAAQHNTSPLIWTGSSNAYVGGCDDLVVMGQVCLSAVDVSFTNSKPVRRPCDGAQRILEKAATARNYADGNRARGCYSHGTRSTCVCRGKAYGCAAGIRPNGENRREPPKTG